MGVMGAFVFAAQMLNFAIPGTGSSGHIVGGILLCAMLGTRAAFVTLSSVIMLQCLLFADGGLLALGCNIINMAAMSCLVAYPAVYRPIAGDGASAGRIFAASILSSVVALELGAVAVVVETSLSGIAQLPPARFLAFMLPIHLLIGLGEGIATGSVLCAVRRYGMQGIFVRPSARQHRRRARCPRSRSPYDRRRRFVGGIVRPRRLGVVDREYRRIGADRRRPRA